MIAALTVWVLLVPEAMAYAGLLIFRFDARIFFANAPDFRESLRAAVASNPSAKAGISLRFSSVKEPVRATMHHASC